MDIYKKIQDERGEAEVLGGFGAVYFDQDYQKSLSYYQEALKKREKVDDRQLIGNTLNSLGLEYLKYFEDFTQAIFWFNKAETIRKEIGDLTGWRTTRTYKGSAYLALGDLLTKEGKYTEALAKLDTALQLDTEIENRFNTGEALSHIGFVYSRLGNYSAAVEKLTESAKIMKEENDSVGLAGVYNNFGVALQGAGRIEKALDYFTNSLKIYQKHDNPDMVLAIMNNMGTIFFDRKEYIKAEDYHEKGLQLSRELNEKDQEVNFLLNLANDQTMLGIH